MKKLFLCVLLAVFLFSNAICVFSQSQGNQSTYVTGDEVITITTLEPDDMVTQTASDRAMAAYVTGSRLMNQNRLLDAERYLLEAIELYPEFVDALDHLGIVYRRLNRFAEAEQMYLRSISINNSNRVPFINLAVVYRIQGRADEAFDLYKRVIEINPNDPEGYYGTGELHFSAKNFDLSLQFFDKAMELYAAIRSPYISHVHYYKGMIYYELKNYEEALKHLEEAQRLRLNIEGLNRTINEIRRILANR